MQEKPILFSSEMVRAILAGRKTQTRRECKPAPPIFGIGADGKLRSTIPKEHFLPGRYVFGDVLWVRETHLRKASGTIYRADYDPAEAAGLGGMYGGWKPSIHMRREDSRLTLAVTGAWVEQLQGISEADAVAEGVEFADFSDLSRRFKNYLAKKEDLNFHGNFSHKTCHWCARASYGSLWDSIYGPGSAAKNPWVWVYQFEVLEVKT